MYGKLFAQMYDGTLGTKGPWKALVTFQQLIILADKNGVVDMTADAISRRTTIPLDIIQAGIAALLEPDPDSRSPDEEGRRIVPVSDSRDWGWRIVNYDHYRKIRSEEDRREYHRQYMRQRRASVKQNVKVSTSGDQCQPIAVSIGSKQKAINTMSGKPDVSSPSREILAFLNQKANRCYRPTAFNLSTIEARLKEGATLADCKQVIAKKVREWGADEKMSQYLRPATLFNRSKFDQYVGELVNAD